VLLFQRRIPQIFLTPPKLQRQRPALAFTRSGSACRQIAYLLVLPLALLAQPLKAGDLGPFAMKRVLGGAAS
jgi:hypothetical protein